MPRRLLPPIAWSEELQERIAFLWADVEACCCQLWSRAKCPVCEQHEAELRSYGAWDLPEAA